MIRQGGLVGREWRSNLDTWLLSSHTRARDNHDDAHAGGDGDAGDDADDEAGGDGDALAHCSTIF